jgi:hypothetical protein
MKACNTCKVCKPISDFYKTRNGKKNSTSDSNGIYHTCKMCTITSVSTYNKIHRTERSSYEYSRRRKDQREKMLTDAKTRAKKSNVPFDIKKSDIVIPTHCPVLGIPLFMGSGSSSMNSPSLDRIVPSLGYVPDNIAVISLRANMIKNDGTIEEHLKIAQWLQARLST